MRVDGAVVSGFERTRQNRTPKQ